MQSDDVKHELAEATEANPLQSILGFSQTIQDQPDMPRAQRLEMVGHIIDQARVLERVSLTPRRLDTTERDLHPRPFEGPDERGGSTPGLDADGLLPAIPRQPSPDVDADSDWMATRAAMEQTIALTSEIVLQPSLCEAAQLIVRRLPAILDARPVAFAGTGAYRNISVGDPPYAGAGATSHDPAEWMSADIADPFSSTVGAIHGTLWIPNLQGDAEDARTLRQLQAAARHLASPMGALAERKHLRALLRTEHGLVRASRALSEERTLEGVLRRIVELACELVDARYGALGVLDDGGTELAEFITVGADAAMHTAIGALPTGHGILGVLIKDAQPLRIPDIGADPRAVGFPAHHPPMRSFLGVPIISDGTVKGHLYLTEKRGDSTFSAEDERVVIALAAQAAVTIQATELYEGSTDIARDLAGANTTLQQADRHKSAFLTNMSHELRTPLNSIIGYATLLVEDSENLDAQQVDDLGVIRASGRHLLALIGDLLDLSKIEAGTMDLRLSEVDLAQLLRDTATSLRPQLEVSGVDLIVEAPESVLICCDRARVRQILLNVLANAVKFTSDGSIYATLTVANDGRVRCEIHDTGPGIPSEDLGRIFEPFFQSGAAMARRPRQSEGAGLGLAITRMLATAHGGDVSIASQLGEGTTVTIALPKIPPHAEGPDDVA